ncbi:alpha/beta-hydrolase [Trametes punicea]|nr:alpha/beta-hydrolase [Trametes punicea]
MASYTTTTVAPSFPIKRVKEGLRLVAKRYVPEASNRDGYTLLLFHCAGSHKESWEPTLDSLLLARNPITGVPVVREAWSFEMQNHGEAASLNLDALKQLEYPLTVEEWAEGFKRYIASGALDGHKLVGIGHSLGASAMILATIADDAGPPVSYRAVVLVEDALMARATYEATREESDATLKMVFEAVTRRRDVWTSREEAFAYFQKRIPWVGWDPRVLKLYVQYGLREIEVQEGDGKATKVTLACSKEQEGFSYQHIAPHFRVGDRLRTLDPSLPIHFVHGDRPDVMSPSHMHGSIVALPQKVASVQTVQDAGHFVVQENPTQLALALKKIIENMASTRASL